MIGQIALISIWTADIVMMGWINTDALAAGTQANRMYQPLYFIAIGLTLAVSPLNVTGAWRQKTTHCQTSVADGYLDGCSLWFINHYSNVVWGNILLWLRQDPAIAEHASVYLRLMGLGMPFTFVFFVLRNYISAYQKPIPPLSSPV